MKPGKFRGTFHLQWLDKNWWKVDRPFSYTTADGNRFLVPKGMITDFGSIPRGLWNLFHRTEFGPAYILHDYLYWKHPVPRHEADRILSEAIYTLTAGDASGKRMFIRFALFLFGYKAWHQKRKKKT